METFKSREPIEVAEIPTLVIDKEVIAAFDSSLRVGRLGLISERLGLLGLDFAPTEYRMENASLDAQIKGQMSDWHVDGRYGELAEAYVLGQPFPTEVLVTDGSINLEDLWNEGRRDLDQTMLERLIDEDLAKTFELSPNVYYRLLPGTIHRRPPIEIGDGNRRIFGRNLVY